MREIIRGLLIYTILPLQPPQGLQRFADINNVNNVTKEWDLCTKSGIEMIIVGLKRDEWDCVRIVG